MNITLLGQAGVRIESAGQVVIIDPYLTDSVGTINPAMSRRFAPPSPSLYDDCDTLIFTHDHLDHYDPESAKTVLNCSGCGTVLAPYSVWEKVRHIGGEHNYVMFNEGVEWTEGDIIFRAIPAVHSEPYAIGVVLFAEGMCVYVTGDTLYSTRLLDSLGQKADVLLLPINGCGNNMNVKDAARFAKACSADTVIPIHYGLTDDLTADGFICNKKTVLEPYEKFEIKKGDTV